MQRRSVRREAQILDFGAFSDFELSATARDTQSWRWASSRLDAKGSNQHPNSERRPETGEMPCWLAN